MKSIPVHIQAALAELRQLEAESATARAAYDKAVDKQLRQSDRVLQMWREYNRELEVKRKAKAELTGG